MNSLVWMSEEKRAEYDWLKWRARKKKAMPRGKARASSTRMARTRRNVVLECCTTSIDIQAYVLGLYALVLDKSVC